MNAPAKNSLGSYHLDFLRGVAAVGVFFAHLLRYFFVDYPDVIHKGLAVRTVYFLIPLGHTAVIFFFVLSGFLVGGGVQGRITSPKWSFRSYFTARFTRLYVALIPALIAGCLIDYFGWHYVGGPMYAASYGNPTPQPLSLSLTPMVFLGNLAFLQTLFVTTFGTNSPLWSLSNEFWYYVAYPCLFAVFVPRLGTAIRVVCGVVAVVVLAGIARPVVPLFLVWLFGAGMAALPVRRFHWSAVGLAWLGVFAALLYAHKTHEDLTSDYALGFASAAVVYFASSSISTRVATAYRAAAHGLSSVSYTLYLAHFPAVIFLSAWWLNGVKMQPDSHGLLMALGAIVAVGAYVVLLWSLGERHTHRVRELFDRRRNSPTAAVAIVPEADAEPVKP